MPADAETAAGGAAGPPREKTSFGPPTGAAPPQAATPELTREEIATLPMRAYHGPVLLVESAGTLPAAIASLRRDPVLGFDIEARPAFRRGESHPPALVQLAGADHVVLVRLKGLALPNALWQLLEEGSVLKVGVGLERDVRDLQALCPFVPGGFLDLTALSAPLGLRAAGLRSLAANLLGFRIGKGAQTSNWEAPALSQGQVSCAATDGWVGRELFQKLIALREEAGLPLLPADPPEPARRAR